MSALTTVVLAMMLALASVTLMQVVLLVKSSLGGRSEGVRSFKGSSGVMFASTATRLGRYWSRFSRRSLTDCSAVAFKPGYT